MPPPTRRTYHVDECFPETIKLEEHHTSSDKEGSSSPYNCPSTSKRRRMIPIHRDSKEEIFTYESSHEGQSRYPNHCNCERKVCQDCLMIGLWGKVSCLQKDLSKIQKQNDIMHKEMLSIKHTVIKQNVVLNMISQKSFGNPIEETIDVSLPITTDSELEMIEQQLDDTAYYFGFKNYIRQIIGKDIKKNFMHIIVDELLAAYNWDGVKGKKSLKSFKNFSKAIFETIKTDQYSFSQFEREMKQAIKLSHCRTHVHKFRVKCKESSMNQENDLN